jgi:hypothetical protein
MLSIKNNLTLAGVATALNYLGVEFDRAQIFIVFENLKHLLLALAIFLRLAGARGLFFVC